MAVGSRTWVVHLPLTEVRHLAGTGHGWLAPPQARLAAALREWLVPYQATLASINPRPCV